MRIILFLLLVPFLSLSQFAEKKIYFITKTTDKPKIDGVINEPIWKNINVANNFTQFKPNNGLLERSTHKTKVKICYDNQNLYFAAIMYDIAPDSILKELCKRDDDNKNNDRFTIVLDPFNNTQVEYNFTVTASGVQIDKKMSKNGGDKSWNAVWRSAVDIFDKGWSVEIAIPLSQIRFPDLDRPWALNMFRNIRRYREEYSWNPIDLKFENYALQSGLLDGVKYVESPIRLSFMPYSSIYMDSYDNETHFPYNYGMDLKYGLNESFTLDMTLIPDFGQVSSDAMVLNLSPFEVKYEEKRQFFNEGIELFNKGGEMFYSRRLQDDLLNASKVTGRTKNGLGVAALNAITNKTNDNPLTNYNVFIIDKALDNSSSVSLMNTNVINTNDEKDANVTGIFTRLNNKKNTHVYDANLKMSQEFFTNSTNVGFSGMLKAAKNSGNYRYELYSIFEDDKYNPNDLGFLYSNNEITNGLNIGYEQLNANKKFIFSEHYLFIKHNTLFTDNKFVNLEIEAEAKYMLKNYLFIMAKIVGNPYEQYDYYEARTNDYKSPLKRSKAIRFSTYMSSDYRNRFAVDFGCGATFKPLYSGNEYRVRISPRIRFNDRASMSYVLSVKDKFNDVGFAATDSLNNPVFAIRNTYMITNVLNASYILNNKMDFSVKLRYHLDQVKNLEFKNLQNDGYLQTTDYTRNEDINYTTWTSDIAFNWWFAPGSQLSLVWKNAIENEDNVLINHWRDNIEESFSLLQQNSISLKVVYYLDYLYLTK
ncbi:MAG: hypothetical protein CBC83_02100 [Flavobacteriales bacterium TMED123]|nr:MAG: hypothetical protein CBC83_02100 [Flavobacteriales bacterium TMED123]|tara:strand:- start:295 stop:2580 length:2286 start_codon:yes stop_codon:yes gene_type:complete